MPVMDGLKAAQLIRMYEENCSSASINDPIQTQQGAAAASDMGPQRMRRVPIIAV